MKTAFVVTVLFVSAAMTATTASAGHQSYCYTGRCLSIDGEQHMIDALRAMDVLFDAPCVRTRGRASVVVQRELGRAIGDVESRDARLLLIKSRGLVGRFVGSGNPVLLDAAAQLVTQAIAAEQLAYEQLRIHDRYSSRRAPIGHSHDFAAPSRFRTTRDFGFSSSRTPLHGHDRGLGYHPYSNFGRGFSSGYQSGFGSGFGNEFPRGAAGCNAFPSSGFSLRFGR